MYLTIKFTRFDAVSLYSVKPPIALSYTVHAWIISLLHCSSLNLRKHRVMCMIITFWYNQQEYIKRRRQYQNVNTDVWLLN